MYIFKIITCLFITIISVEMVILVLPLNPKDEWHLFGVPCLELIWQRCRDVFLKNICNNSYLYCIYILLSIVIYISSLFGVSILYSLKFRKVCSRFAPSKDHSNKRTLTKRDRGILEGQEDEYTYARLCLVDIYSVVCLL